MHKIPPSPKGHSYAFGDIAQSQLANGIRVVTYQRPGTNAAAFEVLYGCGGRHEPDSVVGVSHGLEHMMFKGTPRRTAQQISGAMEGLGAEINAFTAEERTAYHFVSPSDVFADVMDIYVDSLKNSLLAEDEWEKERNVILEERKMYEDMPRVWVQDLLVETMFNLQMGVIGSEKTIRATQPSDMRQLMSLWYHPGNMVVAAAGKVDHNHVRDLVAMHFGDLPRVETPPAPGLPSASSKAMAMSVREESDQANLALGLRAFGASDVRVPVLEVLSSILGGKMSSRLFSEVREKRGLAYSVKSSLQFWSDEGLMMITAGVAVDNAEEATKIILKECARLADSPVSLEELDTAKRYLRGGLATKEDSGYWANELGSQWLIEGTVRSPHDWLYDIKAVTVEEIQAASKDLFQGSLTAACISPQDLTSKLEPLLKL